MCFAGTASNSSASASAASLSTVTMRTPPKDDRGRCCWFRRFSEAEPEAAADARPPEGAAMSDDVLMYFRQSAESSTASDSAVPTTTANSDGAAASEPLHGATASTAERGRQWPCRRRGVPPRRGVVGSERGPPPPQADSALGNGRPCPAAARQRALCSSELDRCRLRRRLHRSPRCSGCGGSKRAAAADAAIESHF